MNSSEQTPSLAAFPSDWTLHDDILPPRAYASAVREEAISFSVVYPRDWSLSGSDQGNPTTSLTRSQDTAAIPDAFLAWPLLPSEPLALGRTYPENSWALPDQSMTGAMGMVPSHVLPRSSYHRRHQSQSAMSASSAGSAGSGAGAGAGAGAVSGNYTMLHHDISMGYHASPLSSHDGSVGGSGHGSDSAPLPASVLARRVVGYHRGDMSPVSVATSASLSQMLPNAVWPPRPAGFAFSTISPHSVITRSSSSRNGGSRNGGSRNGGSRNGGSRNGGSDRHESPVLQDSYRLPWRPAGYRLDDTTPPMPAMVPERRIAEEIEGYYLQAMQPFNQAPEMSADMSTEMLIDSFNSTIDKLYDLPTVTPHSAHQLSEADTNVLWQSLS